MYSVTTTLLSPDWHKHSSDEEEDEEEEQEAVEGDEGGGGFRFAGGAAGSAVDGRGLGGKAHGATHGSMTSLVARGSGAGGGHSQ